MTIARLPTVTQATKDLSQAPCLLRSRKAQLGFDLASLVGPGADAVAEVARFVRDLPALWAEADVGERMRLLLAVLDARAVVSIRPKAAFEAVLGGSGARSLVPLS